MNVKATAAYVGLWFAGVLMMALCLFVLLGVSGEFGWIPEDSIFFYCHFMGNWTCGPDTAWHGFINLF